MESTKIKKDVVVIGAGLGGLFTAAILSREGLRVTLLEKNAAIGGGLQSFRRFGELFDTGMHVLGGLRPGGTVWRICDYLGIASKLRLRDVDASCCDDLYFAEDRRHYTIAEGEEGFVAALAKQFPAEEEGLRRYVKAVLAMAGQIDLFNLRPSKGVVSLFAAEGDFLLPADAFIAKYVADERLRAVLAYMNPLYGGVAGHTPAYIHAIISTLYIRGASRFVGGSSQLAALLAGVVTDGGGRVLGGDAVTHVEVNNRLVDYVETESGQRYTADYYISAIHPCTLLKITSDGAFPRAYSERLNTIPNTHSAFALYIKMREGTFPYINHSEYYMTRYTDVWNFSRSDRPWPLGFLFMTPPEGGEDTGGAGQRYSRKVLVTAPMPFAMVAPWAASTRPGHRGAAYAAWKEARTAELMVQVEELHPGFAAAVEAVEASSPLTIRDYYGVKEGSICGYAKDCQNIALAQLPVVTKVRNLLLTGQNNNLHGICGVPLTAINTCEAILGNNFIVERLKG